MASPQSMPEEWNQETNKSNEISWDGVFAVRELLL